MIDGIDSGFQKTAKKRPRGKYLCFRLLRKLHSHYFRDIQCVRRNRSIDEMDEIFVQTIVINNKQLLRLLKLRCTYASE